MGRGVWVWTMKLNCNIPNYETWLLKTKTKEKQTPGCDSENALIAHIYHDQTKDYYTNCTNNHSEEILVDLKPVDTAN